MNHNPINCVRFIEPGGRHAFLPFSLSPPPSRASPQISPPLLVPCLSALHGAKAVVMGPIWCTLQSLCLPSRSGPSPSPRDGAVRLLLAGGGGESHLISSPIFFFLFFSEPVFLGWGRRAGWRRYLSPAVLLISRLSSSSAFLGGGGERPQMYISPLKRWDLSQALGEGSGD